jgi:hypothetical protein
MTTEETQFLAGKLDGLADRLGRIETRMDGIETDVDGLKDSFVTLQDSFITMKGELRASIWQTAFTIISVYAGAIGLSFALFRLYSV